jgi:ABC-type dipeptide/oligopeptide/nickel transport system permease subunit
MAGGSGLKVALFVLGGAALAVVSGSVGALLSHHLGTAEYTISYSDVIVILLTAISVMLTIMAIIIALVGVVSWTTIADRVRASTESYLADGFKEGNHLFVMLKEKSQAASYSGVEPIGTEEEDDETEYEEENGK